MRLRAAFLAIITAVGLWCSGCRAMADQLDAERLVAIDAHALAAPATVEESPETLARYRIEPARNDAEKARAIFRWITDRIGYDAQAYLNDRLTAMSAEDVLMARSSICDGYATLFATLGTAAGLEVVTVKGFAKGYAHQPGNFFDKPNHAWNAVKIDGQWRLIDSTWGAGFVKNGEFQKVLSEVFFLASPEQLMFSHFPLDEAWQLQSTPHLSKPEFEALPRLEPAFFHIGIAGEDVWKTLQSPDFSGMFVRTFDTPYRMVTVQRAPLSYRLRAKQAQDFRIQTAAFEKMAVLQNNEWTTMPREGEVFALSFTPKAKGELLVVGKKPDATNYVAIMAYDVN